MKKSYKIFLTILIFMILALAFVFWYFGIGEPRAFISNEKIEIIEKDTITSFKVETVLEGLQSPWAIQFMPDGTIYITEREGRLRKVVNDVLLPDAIPGVPEVAFKGQGGLLDITLHPDYENNKLIYLAYTIEENGEMKTRVSRFKDSPEGLTEMEVIFPGFSGSRYAKHFGSRIIFGNDGKLYITLGERGEGERAQDLMDLNGKTLRLNDDGSIPQNNPFYGRSDARWEIFSYGNRNSQGMAIHPETGAIYQTEHGPSGNDGPGGGDEVNLIEAGKNYGWNEVSHNQSKDGMEDPLIQFTPANAPSGMDFYTGDKFPKWENNLFFATLVGRALYRLDINGKQVNEVEVLLKNEFGRLRDVKTGPDGYIYIITSDTDAYGPGRRDGDRLIRLVPE